LESLPIFLYLLIVDNLAILFENAFPLAEAMRSTNLCAALAPAAKMLSWEAVWEQEKPKGILNSIDGINNIFKNYVLPPA